MNADADPVAAARMLVTELFPQAMWALVTGSVVTAARTPGSDLDIVIRVANGHPDATCRRSLTWRGWPAELFIYDAVGLRRYLARDLAGGWRPILHRMLAAGIAVRGEDSRELNEVQARGRAVLDAGPAPLTGDAHAVARYGLTLSLEDLDHASDPGEIAAVQALLWQDTAEVYLKLHQHWIGRGKWAWRELHDCDPGFAARWLAARGDPAPLAREVLQHAGGRLFDGFTLREADMQADGGPSAGDPFGQILQRCRAADGAAGVAMEVTERDDGLITTRDAAFYLSDLSDPQSVLDRTVLARAHGRVLAAGCGAGRHALHLQRLGLDVTGLEGSPGAVRVAAARGVNVVHGDLFTPPARLRGYSTVLLMGGNLGLLGSPQQAHVLLAALGRVVVPGAVLLGEAVDATAGTDPVHVAYRQRNLELGRPAGQVRLRIRDRLTATDWITLWLLSPAELEQTCDGTGWQLRHVWPRDNGGGYLAELAWNPS